MENNALNHITKELNARFGLEGRDRFTSGYIGNLDQFGDHRSWLIFGAHPGRMGNYGDSFGGHGTHDDLVRFCNLRWEALLRWAEKHVKANGLGAKTEVRI